MAKKLFFVVLLLALAIASVDLVVNVSAGELFEGMADKTTDMTKSAIDQTAESTESWADWAKDQFTGFTHHGGASSSQDNANAPSPAVA